MENDIFIATQSGDLEEIKQFIRGRGNVNKTDSDHGRSLLFWATKEGHEEIVSFLLENGADPNLEDHDGWTPISWALEGQILNMLISSGANVNHVNKHDETPLFSAVRFGEAIEQVEILLKAQANPNIKEQHGFSPLEIAARNEDLESAILLMKHGARVNSVDEYGNSPLYWALIRNNSEMVYLFLNAGADVNNEDFYDNSLLHSMAEAGNAEFVELLLIYGADRFVKNMMEQGIKDLTNNQQIVDLLENFWGILTLRTRCQLVITINKLDTSLLPPSVLIPIDELEESRRQTRKNK